MEKKTRENNNWVALASIISGNTSPILGIAGAFISPLVILVFLFLFQVDSPWEFLEGYYELWAYSYTGILIGGIIALLSCLTGILGLVCSCVAGKRHMILPSILGILLGVLNIPLHLFPALMNT